MQATGQTAGCCSLAAENLHYLMNANHLRRWTTPRRPGKCFFRRGNCGRDRAPWAISHTWRIVR